MPRVHNAHWCPGEWPRPLCPGPDGEESCGAPVESYRPPGQADPDEWSVTGPVMLRPCGHIVTPAQLGVVWVGTSPGVPEETVEPEQAILGEYG